MCFTTFCVHMYFISFLYTYYDLRKENRAHVLRTEHYCKFMHRESKQLCVAYAYGCSDAIEETGGEYKN